MYTKAERQWITSIEPIGIQIYTAVFPILNKTLSNCACEEKILVYVQTKITKKKEYEKGEKSIIIQDRFHKDRVIQYRGWYPNHVVTSGLRILYCLLASTSIY